MTIDTTSMDALLGKLEAARSALSRLPGVDATSNAAAAGAKPVDFGKLLKDSISKVDETQSRAMGLAERFQLGDSKVTLEETMVALSKANISFQQMVQVRNRVIQAYHDVMNIQV